MLFDLIRIGSEAMDMADNNGVTPRMIMIEEEKPRKPKVTSFFHCVFSYFYILNNLINVFEC